MKLMLVSWLVTFKQRIFTCTPPERILFRMLFWKRSAVARPVVATAVGGIPEQVKGWCNAEDLSQWNRFKREAATGILVQPGDSSAMAVAIERLLTDESLRRQLAENAAHDARQRFDLKRQAGDYLHWYEKLVEERPPR